MTLEAASRVAIVIQTTNFVGLNNIVGRPIITANAANIPEAIRRYNELVSRLRNEALNGPASGRDPERSWS